MGISNFNRFAGLIQQGLGLIFPVQTSLSVNKYLVVAARPQFDISVQTSLSVNKYLVVTARPQFDISRTDLALG